MKEPNRGETFANLPTSELLLEAGRVLEKIDDYDDHYPSRDYYSAIDFTGLQSVNDSSPSEGEIVQYKNRCASLAQIGEVLETRRDIESTINVLVEADLGKAIEQGKQKPDRGKLEEGHREAFRRALMPYYRAYLE